MSDDRNFESQIWVTEKFPMREMTLMVEASLDDPSCDFSRTIDTETSRTLTSVDLHTNLLPRLGGDGNLK